LDEFIVWDDDLSQSTIEALHDSATIAVEVQPPLADAGPDQTVASEAAFEPDGSNSSHPDGIDTYAWEALTDGAPELSDDATSTPTGTAPEVTEESQTFVYELTVTADGLSATDTMALTVEPVAAPVLGGMILLPAVGWVPLSPE